MHTTTGKQETASRKRSSHLNFLRRCGLGFWQDGICARRGTLRERKSRCCDDLGRASSRSSDDDRQNPLLPDLRAGRFFAVLRSCYSRDPRATRHSAQACTAQSNPPKPPQSRKERKRLNPKVCPCRNQNLRQPTVEAANTCTPWNTGTRRASHNKSSVVDVKLNKYRTTPTLFLSLHGKTLALLVSHLLLMPRHATKLDCVASQAKHHVHRSRSPQGTCFVWCNEGGAGSARGS